MTGNKTSKYVLPSLSKEVLDKLPFGVYVIDSKGVIEYFNPEMLRMSGAKSVDEVVGLNVLTIPTYKKYGLVKYFEQGLKGEPFRVESVKYVSFVGHKLTYRHYNGIPIKDDAGRMQKLLCIVEDITEKKKAEDALKQSEEKYKTLIEEVPIGIYFNDFKGKFLYGNKKAEEIVGYKREDLIGKSFLKLGLLSPKDIGRAIKILALNKRGKTSGPELFVLNRKDGSKRTVEIRTRITTIGTKKVILSMVEDVSERKKAEAKASELNSLKNTLIQVISNQVKVPLDSIQWSLGVLLAGELGRLSEPQKDFLWVIHNAEKDILVRLKEMLTVLDIEENRITFHKSRFSLESDWASVMASISRRCKLKEIILDYESSEADMNVDADAEKIREVMAILAENAVDYTSEKGTISVKLGRKNGSVRFEITDSGIGIPESEHGHIFSRFYRATNASAMKPEAVGLALSIAKYHIDQQGGQIGFESKEGKGSTFWFELPAA